MEKAIILPINANFDDTFFSYERVYVGSEFCQNLTPFPKKLYEQTERLYKRGVKVSLMLPPSTERGIRDALDTVCAFQKVASEVVVNDFGYLEMLGDRFPKLDLVVGRLLSHTVLPISEETTIRSVELLDYLTKTYRVARIEIDERRSQLCIDIPKKYHKKVSFSVYFPYAVAAVTRRCIFSHLLSDTIRQYEDFTCNKECLMVDSRLKLGNITAKDEIYLRGNAHFVKRAVLSKRLEAFGVNRIVYDHLYMDENASHFG